VFNAEKLGLFRYVSTFTVRSLRSHIQKILCIHPKFQNELRELQYSVFDLWRRKIRAFQICIHFYCTIIGVSHIGNPGNTLGNPKWAERVVVLAIRRRKIRAFQICIHFYCAIIGVSFSDLKIIQAFYWIPLSKIKIVTYFVFCGNESIFNSDIQVWKFVSSFEYVCFKE